MKVVPVTRGTRIPASTRILRGCVGQQRSQRPSVRRELGGGFLRMLAPSSCPGAPRYSSGTGSARSVARVRGFVPRGEVRAPLGTVEAGDVLARVARRVVVGA